MGKGKKSKAKKAKVDALCATVVTLPKLKCCESRKRCARCPLRMLKEGTLPDGLTVKRRVLVTTSGKKVTKKALQKAA